MKKRPSETTTSGCPARRGTGAVHYAAPELVEYGTVAKLTQTGSGSIFDFIGMPAMMT